ncbi:MAG: glycerate kinase, partial [Sulfobacillus thermotolerans]|nr:glycerate kinase [Sulfobacillus thermotolerans]
MRVLIAPDSFKETLSSQEAGTAIAQGLQEAAGHFSLRTLSVADGGEGTSQVLLERGAVRHEASATNIYGE